MSSIASFVRVVGILTGTAALFLSSCGSGSTGQSAADTLQLPVEAGPLPLQANAQPVGADVNAPPEDMARRMLTEDQAKVIAQSCQNASEVVAGSECAEALARTAGAPECGDEDLCMTIAKFALAPGEAPVTNSPAGTSTTALSGPPAPTTASPSMVLYRSLIWIRDERPGSPLCSDGPGGLCFAIRARPDAVSELLGGTPGEPGGSTSTTTAGPTDGPTPTDRPGSPPDGETSVPYAPTTDAESRRTKPRPEPAGPTSSSDPDGSTRQEGPTSDTTVGSAPSVALPEATASSSS